MRVRCSRPEDFALWSKQCERYASEAVRCFMLGRLSKVTPAIRVLLVDPYYLCLSTTCWFLCILRSHHLKMFLQCLIFLFFFFFHFFALPACADRGNRSGHRFDDQDVLVPWHLAVAKGSKADAEKKPKRSSLKNGAIATSAAAQTSTSTTDVDATQSLPRPKKAAAPPPEHAAYDAQKQAVVVQRYCHVYQEGELRGLLEPLSVRFFEWKDDLLQPFSCVCVCVCMCVVYHFAKLTRPSLQLLVEIGLGRYRKRRLRLRQLVCRRTPEALAHRQTPQAIVQQ